MPEEGDDGGVEGDPTGADEGDGTPGAEDGEDTGIPEELPPPEEVDETVTQPDITRRVGQNESEGDSSAGAGEGEGAAAEEIEEPGGEPDPAEVAECITGEVEELITALEELLGAGFEEIATEIEEGLGTLDPTDPTALPTFLEELPTKIEESGGEFTEEAAGLVRGSIEGIVACLPDPPEENPGGENPGGENPGGENPEVTPVGNEDPYYENCDDARAQGAAPVYAGQPGYGRHLDADNDGIGCEEDTVVPVTHTGGLAYTGTEIAPQLKLGAVLLLVGSGLLFATRRRA